MRAVLCVHLLAFILDGDLAGSEMPLWETVCAAAGPGVATFDPAAVAALCVRFRGINAVGVMDLLNAFHPSRMKAHDGSEREKEPVPFNIRAREFFHDVEACLAI